MEENKQIEEMAEWVCSYNCDRGACFGGCENCDNYKLANNLYDANYRKIPEGSVVMTREKYVDLTLAKQSIFKMLDERDDKARKETAREIFDELGFITYRKQGKAYIFDVKELRELAKQYGVEVEE